MILPRNDDNSMQSFDRELSAYVIKKAVNFQNTYIC